MATEVRRRRGSLAEVTAFDGAEGELVIVVDANTDNNTAVVFDGSGADAVGSESDTGNGGFILARSNFANVDPATGRLALELNTGAKFNAFGFPADATPLPGSHPGTPTLAVNTQEAPLGEGAYLNAGTLAGELVQLDGSGDLPTVGANNLVDFPYLPDIKTLANSALTSYITLDENNVTGKLMFDGFSDAYVDDSSVDLGTSINTIYNAGSKTFTNSISGTDMTIQSTAKAVSYADPAAAIVVFYAGAASIAANLQVEVARDGGTDFATSTVVDRGLVLDGTVKMFTAIVDLSGVAAGSSAVLRINTLNNVDAVIHGAYITWQKIPVKVLDNG